MFNGKNEYKSDIKLGRKYRDKNTGFTGTATAVVFYQHGCERVTLKGMNNHGEIVEYGFDSPEVEDVETGKTPQVEKTGGPHGIAPMSR